VNPPAVGDLCVTDSLQIWDKHAEEFSSTVIDFCKPGELVLVLEVRGKGVKVLTPKCKVGWIDGLGKSWRGLHAV
jgi:hypothetical protein